MSRPSGLTAKVAAALLADDDTQADRLLADHPEPAVVREAARLALRAALAVVAGHDPNAARIVSNSPHPSMTGPAVTALVTAHRDRLAPYVGIRPHNRSST